MMIFAFCVMTLLFVIACSFCQRFIAEKNILREHNTKLERVHTSDDALIKRYIKTIRQQTDTLRAVVTECHGVIGACVTNTNPKDDMVAERERSLEAILTECHATLGNDVSSCFGSLASSEQQHYAKHPYPVNHTAPWSQMSKLQGKHAAERKLRKAQNKPGFGKFTIDAEPSEPADVVYAETKPYVSVTTNNINADTPTKPFI